MSMLDSFAGALITLRNTSSEFNLYLRNQNWILDGLPDSGPFPVITIDTWYAIARPSKEQYDETVTLFISVWHERGLAHAKEADAIALLMAQELEGAFEGIFIQPMDRQRNQDPTRPLDRVRLQFKLSAI